MVGAPLPRVRGTDASRSCSGFSDRRDSAGAIPGAGFRLHYDAFISYSQAADGRLAPALQRGLEQLARPWNRRRAVSVFRDATSLAANPSIWEELRRALTCSRRFILLASPDAARSQSVNREIELWLAVHPVDTLILVLTDGTLAWDPERQRHAPARSTALPPALDGAFHHEPMYADLRWARSETQLDLRHSRFRAQVAAIAAPLHGVAREDLEGEDIRQHRRARRLVWSASTALVLLTVISLVTAAIAIANADTAASERRRAEGEQLRSETNARTAARQRERALQSAKSARQNARLARRNSQIAEDNAQAADESANALTKANESLTTSNRQLATERDRADSHLIESMAVSVAAQATSRVQRSSDLSLLMAAAASQLRDNPSTYQSILQTVSNQNALRRIGNGTFDAAVSSDGTLVAQREDSQVTIWQRGPNIEDNGRLRAIDLGLGRVESLSFGPGHLLGVACYLGLAIVDADTGSVVRRKPHVMSSPRELRFLTDGHTLAGVSETGAFTWDSAGDEPPNFLSITGPWFGRGPLAFNHDGSRIAMVRYTSDLVAKQTTTDIFLTDTKTDGATRLFSSRRDDQTFSRGEDTVRFSADDRQLVLLTPSTRPEVAVLDSRSGRVLTTRDALDLNELVVGFSDDASQIAYFDASSQTIRSRDAVTGTYIGTPVNAEFPFKVVFGPSPTDLITLADGALFDFDRTIGRNPLVHQLVEGVGPPGSAVLSPNGRYAGIIRSRSDPIAIVDLTTGQDAMPPFDPAPFGKVLGLAIDSSATRAAINVEANGSGRIVLVDLGSRRQLWSASDNDLSADLAFSHDGQVLGSGFLQHRKLDTSTGQPIASDTTSRESRCFGSPTMTQLSSGSGSVQFYCSPDGAYIVRVRRAGTAVKGDSAGVLVFRAADGQRLAEASPRGGLLAGTGVAFRNDSSAIALVDESDRTHLLALPSLQEIGEVRNVPVDSVAFDDDNNLVLASGSRFMEERTPAIARAIIGRRDLVGRACALADRSLTEPEWQQLFGTSVVYEARCGQPLHTTLRTNRTVPPGAGTEVLSRRVRRSIPRVPDLKPAVHSQPTAPASGSIRTHPTSDRLPEYAGLSFLAVLLAVAAILLGVRGRRRTRGLPD